MQIKIYKKKKRQLSVKNSYSPSKVETSSLKKVVEGEEEEG
jgi:hypothetical protein